MTPTAETRARLAAAVGARRIELGLSVREAAKRAGVDRDTWTAIEEGTRNTRADKYAGIEQALMWVRGSIEAILGGGRATNIGEERGPLDELDQKIEWFREEAERVEADRDLEPDIRENLAASLRKSYLLYRRLKEARDRGNGNPGSKTA